LPSVCLCAPRSERALTLYTQRQTALCQIRLTSCSTFMWNCLTDGRLTIWNIRWDQLLQEAVQPVISSPLGLERNFSVPASNLQSSSTGNSLMCLRRAAMVKQIRLFTARRSYASAVLRVVILSVCPSVSHTRALWLIQRSYRRYFYTTWKDNPSSFLPPNRQQHSGTFYSGHSVHMMSAFCAMCTGCMASERWWVTRRICRFPLSSTAAVKPCFHVKIKLFKEI